MDNNSQGDLTDIIRGCTKSWPHLPPPSATSPSTASSLIDSHLSPPSDHPNHFPHTIHHPNSHNFGDPFSSIPDNPFLHHLNSSHSFMTNSSTGSSACLNDVVTRPCNIFSRMLQISPSSKVSASSSTDHNKNNDDHSSANLIIHSSNDIKLVANSDNFSRDAITSYASKNCLINNVGIQISPLPNPGIKRRKSQVKKVVCIPAPAAMNSRQTGEVVPSDLWAWRKYGQKPIKGSPYPRGYYRCSSSKGCSARKQVERSRTDPNMLVITYTSEHNHPWPTQRNALAGSTRSNQPLKTVNASSKILPSSDPQDHIIPKELTQQQISSSTNKRVKDYGIQKFNHEKQLRATMQKCNDSEDFFADLEELGTESLNHLFTEGFEGDEKKESNTFDQFSVFDWSANSNAKRGSC